MDSNVRNKDLQISKKISICIGEILQVTFGQTLFLLQCKSCLWVTNIFFMALIAFSDVELQSARSEKSSEPKGKEEELQAENAKTR